MPKGVKYSPTLDQLIDKGLFDRLPRTFGAYSLDRIRDWERLFPAEKNYFDRLFSLLDRSEPAAVEELFAALLTVEEKMGIDPAKWHLGEFTLEHVDFLERSPHLAEWRQAVADVFARIDPLLDAEVARGGHSRLVIVLTPAELPMGPDRMWGRIKERGKVVALGLPGDLPLDDYVSLLLTGAPHANRATTLFDAYAAAADRPRYDIWTVEAGNPLMQLGKGASAWTAISYERMAELRDALMQAVNDMLERERPQGPRELGASLKKMNPPALEKAAKNDSVMANFLQSVLLNGNGTLLINNTFVEWATVQAVRRARPSLLGISFGIRNKIKPFSSLLIYADQEEANPIPTQGDMLGSYVDLEVFYQYLWQECEKYPEYRRNTVYLFAGQGIDGMLVIGPADFPLLGADQPLALFKVHEEAKRWLHL